MKKTPEERDIETVEKETRKLASIEAMSLTEGAEYIAESLISDVVSAITTLSIKYPTLTMQEFVSLGAELKSKMDLLKVIHRSAKNAKEFADSIAETIAQ